MKTLIFSDTHFTIFDEKRFLLLENLISSVDRVIINWDFWEKDKISFDEFCENWQKLFNVLKTKNTIYIFWNHDPENLVSQKANLFSDIQLWNYKFSQENIEYYVEHWHSEKLSRKTKLRLKIPKKTRFFLKNFLTKLFLKLKIYEKVLWKKPKKLLQAHQIQQTQNFSSWFIFSDIHRPFVDEKNKIANTGFIDNWFFSYILIDWKNLELIQWKY